MQAEDIVNVHCPLFCPDSDHMRLGKKDANHEVSIDRGVAVKRLFQNNTPQLNAIKMALTQSLAMIQGPPGLCIMVHHLLFLPMSLNVCEDVEVYADLL